MCIGIYMYMYCVYIFVCIYMYMCVYIYICVYIYVCVYIYIYNSLMMCIFMCTLHLIAWDYARVYCFMWIYAYIYICLYICMCVYAYICLYMCMNVYPFCLLIASSRLLIFFGFAFLPLFCPPCLSRLCLYISLLSFVGFPFLLFSYYFSTKTMRPGAHLPSVS